MARSVSERLVFSLAALALTLAVVAPVSAQDDGRARARAAYAEGQRLFEAGEFQAALDQFEAAWAAVESPPPVVLLGIASAEERLGRTADAIETLNRYLVVRPDAPDRASIEERIRTLGGTVAPPPGTVGFASDPPGAIIGIDGTPTTSATPADVALPPGEHAWDLALDGYDLATGTVTVTSSGRAEVSVTLTATEGGGLVDVFAGEGEGEGDEADPETPPAPPPSSDPSAATWAMFAVTGVTLVAGTVFGFMALSRQSDFDVTPTAAAANEGETFALVADLSFGVTVAAGITAIVLYATDRPAAAAPSDTSARREGERGPEIAVAPLVGPTFGGAAVGGSF